LIEVSVAVEVGSILNLVRGELREGKEGFEAIAKMIDFKF
jgi:hypothetical protein